MLWSRPTRFFFRHLVKWPIMECTYSHNQLKQVLYQEVAYTQNCSFRLVFRRWHTWQSIHQFLKSWCNVRHHNRSHTLWYAYFSTRCPPDTLHDRGTRVVQRLLTLVVLRADYGTNYVSSNDQGSTSDITHGLVQCSATSSLAKCWRTELLFPLRRIFNLATPSWAPPGLLLPPYYLKQNTHPPSGVDVSPDF